MTTDIDIFIEKHESFRVADAVLASLRGVHSVDLKAEAPPSLKKFGSRSEDGTMEESKGISLSFPLSVTWESKIL